MKLELFATTFVTIFLAELGDKTQLATLLFAADRDRSRLVVFLAAASALVVAAALGVLAGGAIAHIVPPRTLRILGGIGFILVGAWMLAGTRA